MDDHPFMIHPYPKGRDAMNPSVINLCVLQGAMEDVPWFCKKNMDFIQQQNPILPMTQVAD